MVDTTELEIISFPVHWLINNDYDCHCEYDYLLMFKITRKFNVKARDWITAKSDV